MTTEKQRLRVLFCGAVLQNFFDLPASDIGKVWAATGEMLKGIRDLPGVEILGTIDDDQTMVGTSPTGWPWTFYILAEVPDRETAVAACNLFRTIEVGEYRLWKYMRVEARIGRELVIPA
ncbi:hypothetical protein HY78_23000 [Rhizorhabdus wittichii DC-6]|jgi:hypothetical protein|uniref:IacB n=1 Tax=Rhizorhabdus wittichii TaxID=160791 RepID=A0A975D5E8_9SPHN|nr:MULTISPECIES: hypothetical protein [Sphingomonadaceae]ARR56118.1 hypothetical protein HY78_23000 [Rhizorhabdus wittichii DC-6]QTH23109.1 hypothetical protein HRJ34_06265 [Rhizorhabdus wittichii]